MIFPMKNPKPTKDITCNWATRYELAERYNVHPRTIDDWRDLGFLPYIQRGTRFIRFDIQACDQWIDTLREPVISENELQEKKVK
jgi:hypothetical protein